MTIEHLVLFNLALLVAIASPGPALLMAIQTSLSSGRKAGIAVGCGLGLMAALWTLMALLGLDTVFSIFPWAYTVTKIAGATYLIYLSWQIWRSAGKPISTGAKPAQRAFRDGFLINVLNPKSVLFAASVLVVIFPPQMTPAETAIVVLNHLLIEVIFYTAFAFCMTTKTVRNAYFSAKVFIDRAAALFLGALGIRLLLSE